MDANAAQTACAIDPIVSSPESPESLPHSPPVPFFSTMCSVDARSTPSILPSHGFSGAQCDGSFAGLEPLGPAFEPEAAHIPSTASVHFLDPTMPSLIECCTLLSSSCVVFKFGPHPTSQFNTLISFPSV